MKKTTKKILAIVLCVAMCLSTIAVGIAVTSDNGIKTTTTQIVPANQEAKSSENQSEDVANTYETLDEATQALAKSNEEDPSTVYPLVVIPGMGMSRCSVFNTDGTRATMEDGSLYPEWTVFSLVTDDIKELIWPAVKSLITQKDAGLTDKIKELAPSIFRYHIRGTDTKMKYNVQALKFEYPVSEYAQADKDYLYRMLPFENYTSQAGEDNTFVFNYACFSNTYEEADNLNAYIEMVKARTGAEKVNLLPISLGGTVASAYFDKYGKDDNIGKVVSVVAAWDGSDAFADVLTANYASNSKELLYNKLLPELLGKTTGNLLNIALRLFPNSLLRQILDVTLEQLQDLVLVNTTSMWALVPHERYQAIADKLLNDSEHAYVKSLADRYYQAQSSLKDTMYNLRDNYGVKFYFIAGYDLQFGEGWTDYQYFKFFDSATKTNADGIIQISSTGVGTNYVTAHTSFTDAYKQSHPNARLSPDGSIDASTCYFPDQIWYFEGQHHEIAYNNIVHKLVAKILLTDDVNSVADVANEFPQFNQSRYVKKVIRDYMPTAQTLLSAQTLSQQDAQELQSAVNGVNAMLERTVSDRTADDQVIAVLYNKLIDLGAVSVPAEASATTKATEYILEFISDVLYKALGPKGFSEILSKSK